MMLLKYEFLSYFKKFDYDNNLPNDLKLYNAYTGLAGVLYISSALKQSVPDIDIDSKQIENLARLLISKRKFLLQFPGLYGGSGGIAVSISGAIATGIMPRTSESLKFITDSLLKAETTVPELFYGLAGQGLAAIRCGRLLDNTKIISYAKKYAHALIKIQEEDGSWSIPESKYRDQTKVYYGFAHGVSGIAYFLLEYYKNFPEDIQAKIAAEKAIRFLIRRGWKSTEGNRLNWSFSTSDKTVLRWWCHGSPGISLTFMKAYEVTKKSAYLDYVYKTLINYNNTPLSNINMCHGVSGLGEVYLTLDNVIKDAVFSKRAKTIFNALVAMADVRKSMAYWSSNDIDAPSTSLMLGSGGTIYFLLDYMNGGRLGFPMLGEHDGIVTARG